ncbi:hypothetical protein B0T21DRAFT_72682 [Apiosordaria backusii]|uniref:Uncharacterized protein n=1 Tax=Apiosordaria backusii TaxID=314023 RepID=A0AA40AAB9_9PEZI|nr:hypothetical protein B0T21DRAFT_72682 [Apiosordaria backusii]
MVCVCNQVGRLAYGLTHSLLLPTLLSLPYLVSRRLCPFMAGGSDPGLPIWSCAASLHSVVQFDYPIMSSPLSKRLKIP